MSQDRSGVSLTQWQFFPTFLLNLKNYLELSACNSHIPGSVQGNQASPPRQKFCIKPPLLLCVSSLAVPSSTKMCTGRRAERYEFIFCIVKASTLPSNHPDTKAMQLGSPTSTFCPEQRHFPMHGMISHCFP